MFTKEQIETIVASELRTIVFLAEEDGSVFLNDNGHADPEFEDGNHYDESNASDAFKDALADEIATMMKDETLMEAFNNYAVSAELLTGETIESRFGVDLGAERVAGLGFSEQPLDADTAGVLVEWVESLSAIELFAVDEETMDSFNTPHRYTLLTPERLKNIVTAELDELLRLRGENSDLNPDTEYSSEDVSMFFSETLEAELLDTYYEPEVEEAFEAYFQWNENQPAEKLLGRHIASARMGVRNFEGSLAEEATHQVIFDWASGLGQPNMYLGANLRIDASW